MSNISEKKLDTKTETKQTNKEEIPIESDKEKSIF
jgi:hypothetical protein